ncbi:PQQ-binding-like beta-propeller repeat protein [Natronoglomus mannanivorans]|uniref:PQQ-like beta-propeller repeat protein n=1 Tax=Natronoglomus mannanivorans TaxID=2979990 RepID=A0AAP2YWT1_9EURY|nr:PQQ-like beta-propeller repeat protein [Halobacteria archaeon AArc-xg1-1]
MASLSGCTGRSDDSSGNGDSSDTGGTTTDDSSPGSVADDSDYGAWPMARYDASNRLSVPHDGLDGEPEILWTAELESTVSPPVVYDDTAFVSHGSGLYTAVDLEDGEPVWEHETVGRAAPAVSDAAVFVAGDGVEALDRDNGDVLWSTEHDESVESIRVYDGAVYAGIGDRVVGLDEEGEELLEIEATPTVQSLAIDDERIYVRSRIDPDEYDFVMAGYDRDSGDHLWEHEISQVQQWFDDRVTRTFPLVNGMVYTIDGNAVVSIDGAEGELTEVVEFDETDPWTRPTILDKMMYVRVREPTAYNLETDTIPTEWDPEKNTRYSFVTAGGASYTIRGTGYSSPPNLMSMDLGTGEINWEKQAPELDEAHIPVVLDGLVLLPINDPGLVAFG